ncbi:phosphoenolpyruvate-utilizing N-terminal domain-containing protein [Mycoplasmopsis bovis]|uniref:phosphoenolpyruvate-utilizing N-terminal domain-containing protein n=1 Tax=Mycoplasmopsis bovis TaxID=28903 RepID=UPI001CF3415A|nr:phosphoenolpyruvate-utilizing N-terminal domain-containing protein [Mycoplasmopsis bovis]
MHIKGIGASKGIAIAKAFKINELPLEILNNSKGVEFETNLFDKAVKQIAEDIQHTIEVATTKEQKEIFGAHLLLAQDPVAAQDIKNAIKDDNKSAIYATNEYFSIKVIPHNTIQNVAFWTM